MPRNVCPELYPDPRPTRLLAPLLLYLPVLVRLAPWLAVAPAAGAFGVLLLAAQPLLTWAFLSVAVFAPVLLGAALFTFGWD